MSLRFSVTSKTKGFEEGAVPNEEYVEVGRDLEEGIKAAKYLQDAGYDMLNADNGTYDAWYWAHPPVYMPLNCNLKEAEKIKEVVDIPVVCAGRMQPDVAAEAIKEGKLDGMGVARQFLTDSEYIIKIKDSSYVSKIFKEISKFDNITKFVVEDASLNEIFIEKVGEAYEK